MTLPSFFSPLRTPRGITLVELMIVVAIIGVLAAIAIPSFRQYLRKGKVAQLQQLAMDVARGQESYRGRGNNTFFNPTPTEFAKNEPHWAQILEFNPDLSPEFVVESQAGVGNTTCGLCTTAINPSGRTATPGQAWYIVRVRQDLPGVPVAEQLTVIITSDEMRAIVLNEY